MMSEEASWYDLARSLKRSVQAIRSRAIKLSRAVSLMITKTDT